MFLSIYSLFEIMSLEPVKFDDYKVGDSAKFTKTITEEDVMKFAEVTGDFNPIHVDPEFAAKTPFKGTIAHGLLSVGFLSQMMMYWMPHNWIWCGKLTVAFLKPLRPGDKVVVKGEVKDIKGEKIFCDVTCQKKDGTKLVQGVAEIEL